MCYTGYVYCSCCGRQYDNGVVAGCGCTGNQCDECIAKCGCKVVPVGEAARNFRFLRGYRRGCKKCHAKPEHHSASIDPCMCECHETN